MLQPEAAKVLCGHNLHCYNTMNLLFTGSKCTMWQLRRLYRRGKAIIWISPWLMNYCCCSPLNFCGIRRWCLGEAKVLSCHLWHDKDDKMISSNDTFAAVGAIGANTVWLCGFHFIWHCLWLISCWAYPTFAGIQNRLFRHGGGN